MPKFKKSFDELLDGILTDYRNQFPEADTSQGSLIFITSACQASALWGLYNYQEWIARQIFPDTADPEFLEHHAFVRGLTRGAGETDAEYLDRLLDYIRRPPAGGNKYDYVKWAREVEGVEMAYSFPLAQGLGSVDVVIVADAGTTGSEIPSPALVATVQAHIDDERPVTAKTVRVLAPVTVLQDVSLEVTGAAINLEVVTAEGRAYMNALKPGQTCHRNRLAAAAILVGAENAVVLVPAADVIPLPYEILRPGTITVERIA